MKPRFAVVPGPHSYPDHVQWSIQADDLTLEECETMQRIVCNQWTPSKDYQLKQGAEPFLQCYNPPVSGSRGYILVEFWSEDRAAIDRFVDHVNAEIAALERPRMTP